jgi:hypothetical protein
MFDDLFHSLDTPISKEKNFFEQEKTLSNSDELLPSGNEFSISIHT